MTRLQGLPEITPEPRKDSYDKPKKPHWKKKSFKAATPATPGAHGKPKPKGKFAKEPRVHPESKKPWSKPGDKPAIKSKGKKPYKSKFAKAGGKNSGTEDLGSSPRMRKKNPK